MAIVHELLIPHMGSVENAKLLAWRVGEGQSYGEGDILYEVETDKTATEIEADAPGILVRQLVEPGADMKVGDRVGLWAPPATPAADIAAALSEAEVRRQEAAPTKEAAVAETASEAKELEGMGKSPRLSPLVRRLAAEHGVDPAAVKGTGPGGRVTGDDVLAAARAGNASHPSDPPASPYGKDSRVVAHSLRRQTIARNMETAAAIPTLTADMEIDLSALEARRRADKAEGRAVSILGYIAHAAVAVLVEDPRLNAHWTASALVRFSGVHLGIAVETPAGLVVPVIRDAQTLDAAALTAEIATLADRARRGSLRAEELSGGSFTISNPGALGPVLRAEALLNPPQIALLGLPGVLRAVCAVERDGLWSTEVRPVIRPSLSFDHRAVDGGPVITFLNQLKGRLESL